MEGNRVHPDDVSVIYTERHYGVVHLGTVERCINSFVGTGRNGMAACLVVKGQDERRRREALLLIPAPGSQSAATEKLLAG
jgi:hypothetical protein